MKIKIYIVICLMILLACQSKEREGIWVAEYKLSSSYALANISNDSLSLKFLSSFNYHLSNKPQLFIEKDESIFSNDSIQVEMNLTDSLELRIYKNDSLIEVQSFCKLNQYKPKVNIADFKSELVGKSVKYEMKGYEVLIDIVDQDRCFNHSVQRYPIGIEYFDIFEFGDEVFFVFDTGYPLPIQLVIKKENKDQVYYITEFLTERGQIIISERGYINENLQGNWKANFMNTDKNNLIDFIGISKDSFIVNWKDKKESGAFEISKLSKDSLYVLKADNIDPFFVRIEPIDSSVLQLTNYRSGRESKLKLSKE